MNIEKPTLIYLKTPFELLEFLEHYKLLKSHNPKGFYSLCSLILFYRTQMAFDPDYNVDTLISTEVELRDLIFSLFKRFYPFDFKEEQLSELITKFISNLDQILIDLMQHNELSSLYENFVIINMDTNSIEIRLEPNLNK